MSLKSEGVAAPAFNWQDYIALARPEHWVKHIFIVPGVALALLLVKEDRLSLGTSLTLCLVSACLLASANYVINGWLDGKFDRFHPSKQNRPAATGRVMAELVYLEYALLIASGLGLAWFVSTHFFVTAVIFVVMGVIYNVRPLRFKDHAFLDVLTESVNNPLRLMMGWSAVSATTIPPLSLFIAYWFGGAFLMAAKRLAEYHFIARQNKLEDLYRYRKSFATYTDSSLLVSSFLYALISSFFTAAFLIKHRPEFLFLFPAIAVLFTYYLHISLAAKSVAQAPEKLHTDRGLVMIVSTIVVLSILLLTFDVPLAERIVGNGRGLNYVPWR